MMGDMLKDMLFGMHVKAHGEDWIIVQYGIGYSSKEKMNFHLAVKKDGNESVVQMIGITDDDFKAQREAAKKKATKDAENAGS